MNTHKRFAMVVLILVVLLAGCEEKEGGGISTPPATQFPPLEVTPSPSPTPVVVEKEVVVEKPVVETVIVVEDGDVLQLSGLEFPPEMTQEGPDGGTAIMVPAPEWQPDPSKPLPVAKKVTAGKVTFIVQWVEEEDGVRQDLWISTVGKNYVLQGAGGGGPPYLNLSADVDGVTHKVEIWRYGEDVEHGPHSHIAVVFPDIPYQ